jgi:integrase
LHVHKVSHPPLQNLLQHGLAFVFVITPYRRELIDSNPCDRIEWDGDEYSNKFVTSAGIRERTYTEKEMDLLWNHEQSVITKRPTFLTSYAMLLISGDGTYIFPGEAADGCLGINSIYKHYTRACAAAGIPIQKDVIRGPHAWRRNFAKRLGNSYISSHLLGNDQKVCEENYSNAIDFAETLAELEKKGLKKGLKTGLKMDQTLKKEA